MKRRTAFATIALVPLAACVVNLSFEIDKQFALASAAAGSISQTQVIQLSDYSAITDHKDQIKSLDLDYADVTVLSVTADNTATQVTGTLALRASGAPADGSQDVQVGTLTNFPLQPNQTVRLPGTPALDAFLLQQLDAAGTFSAILSGTVDGRADLVVDVDLHASIGYDAGLF